MAAPHQHITLDEFLRIPEQEPALEYEDRTVTQKVSPKGKHSALQYALAEHLNRFASTRKLARAFPELRTTYAGRSYVPDLAVYRWERIPIDDAGQVANDFWEPPDIAVEIVSPEQRTTALVQRCLWYVAHGVRVALMVDPADESVLVFQPDRTPEALQGQDRIVLGDLLPGFALTAQELFDSLRMG
jgi:Uma2 family endonuclease